jgi:beta-glucosidase
MAIHAGIDMSMTPYDASFAAELIDLVEAGDVSEARIDDSVRRILDLKFGLGLFDQPVSVGVPPMAGGFPNPAALSQKLAAASLVLLENAGRCLPLDAGTTVYVDGPGADSRAALCGPWSYTWQGADEAAYPTDVVTVREAIAGDEEVRLVDDSSAADVVVYCLSEVSSVEKPGDVTDPSVDTTQSAEIRAHLVMGRSVIVLLHFDRPRILGEWIHECAAVVWVGRPGPFGARALSDLLCGRTSPQGRLPFTYPRHATGHLPYDHRMSDRLGTSYGLSRDYTFDSFDPRWRFGHGLSYAEIAYDDLRVHTVDSGYEVSVRISNRSERDATEVVQVYLSDLYASVAPPVERLCGYATPSLAAGERRRVECAVPREALGRHTPGGFVIEPGEFEFRVEHLSQRIAVGPEEHAEVA